MAGLPMRYIKVKVRYLSPYIRNLVGVDEEIVITEEGSSIRDVIMKIAKVRGEQILNQLLRDDGRDLREGILIAVNDTVVQDINYKVEDGCTLSFLIALDGG